MDKNQHKINKDLFHLSSEEDWKKIEFFWEHCIPDDECDVSNSIREKTICKIQQETNLQIASSKKKKNLRTFYITVASVAASIIIILTSVHVFRDIPQKEDIKQVVAMMDLLPLEEMDDVVLVMSDLDKLQLTTDAKVSYTPEGTVSVNSEKIPLPNEEKQTQKKTIYQELYNQLIVPKGKRSQLLLSDGTKVWVNAGTKVIYPRVFSGKKREIYVEGEVYLEVTRDENRPFYVNTNGFEVKVLGTSFDVSAYKQMTVGKVVLVNGSVEIKDQHNEVMRMVPNELVTLEQNRISEKKTVNASDYKAWVDGLMILDGIYLKQLTERLNLLYGRDIVCDPSLDNEQIYGKLDLRDDLGEIMDYIKSMIPLSTREENGVIYLRRE